MCLVVWWECRIFAEKINSLRTMPKITRKIEIRLDPTGLSEEECKRQWTFLYHVNDNLYRVANRLVSQLYLADEIDNILRFNDQEYVELRKQLNKKSIDNDTKAQLELQMQDVLKRINDRRAEILNRPQRSFAYSVVIEEGSNEFNSKILDELKQNVLAHYKTDTKEVRRGDKSLSNYRKGMPIPFAMNNSTKLMKQDGIFYLKWYDGIKFILNFGRDASNNQLIVERCLGVADDGITYKACSSSSIQICKRGNHTKMFLLLCVDIPVEKNELRKDMVVGVDLGLNVPVYAATNRTLERKAIGSRESFLNQRGAFQRRFKALQRLQTTKGGRGRLHKLEPLERLREAEKNWVRTQNHLFSKEVVQFAKDVGAATINMEKLTNFGKDRQGDVYEDKKYVLRNWSYFELQNLIEYKAKMAGIKVRYINPAFTSQTCSECGELGERDSIHFVCKNPDCPNCGKDIHADYNGARNIAKSKDIIKD